MKARKTYDKILVGSRNIRFDDLCQLAKAFGFALDRNHQAKPCQIRQLLDLVEENGLALGQ